MKTSSRTFGLLIEIILSTVFFSVISIVILQVFQHAQRLEQVSREKSGAMILAQSVGDIFRSQQLLSSEDFADMLSHQYDKALLQEGDQRYLIRLDETMQPCLLEPGDPSSGVTDGCFASVDISEILTTSAGTLSHADIQVIKQGMLLFSLGVDVYKPGGES